MTRIHDYQNRFIHRRQIPNDIIETSYLQSRLRPVNIPGGIKTRSHRLKPNRNWVVVENKYSNRYTHKWVQGAFKSLMTHVRMQFARRIAFRCVLHRYENQDIRC